MAFVYDELNLYIWPEPVVMAATINGIIAPGAMSIPYVFVSGVEADVKAGMTLLAVGCGPMGRDIRIRIRSINVGSAILNVAENGIYWATNAVIRVLKFFEPWSVVPRITVAGAIATFYADYDIVCTDQTQYPEPVVVMGPNHAGPPGEEIQFPTWESWFPGGATQASIVYTSDGGTLIATNKYKYNTPGAYLVTCQVTDTEGKVGTGYRHIFIGEPKRNCGISSFEGSRQTGGYTVKCWTTDTWTDLHDGALIMFRWKMPGQGSYPYIAFIGYVQDSSIKFDYAKQRTEFTAISLSLVLNKLDVFGSSLGFKANAPYTWNEVRNLDLDSAVSTHLRWHTTVLQIADVRPILNTYQIQKADFARGGGFSPVRDFLKVACRGDVVCDAQGTFWCEREQNMLALSARNGTSYIIEREDWRADPQVEDDAIPSTSYMEVGGVAYSGATGTFGAYLSQAPGPLPDRYGTSEIVEGLALPTTNPQTWLNEIAGFIFADKNNRFQRIQIPAVGRWKKSDIAPQAWALTRGFPWVTDSRIQISRIRHVYNPRQQYVLSDLEAFAETWGPPGFSKAIPVIPPAPPEPPYEPPYIPPPVCDDPTALNYGLPGPCVYATVDITVVWNGHQIGASLDFYQVSSPTWYNVRTSGLALPNTGDIQNVAVADNGTAWCLTYKDEFTLDDNGTWYCPDITAAVPYWELLQSITDYRAEMQAKIGYPIGGYPISLGVDDANIFYIHSEQTIWVGHGTVPQVFPIPNIEWLNPGLGANQYCTNYQHAIGRVRGVAGVRGGHSNFAGAGRQAAIYNHDAFSWGLNTNLLGEFYSVCGQFVIVSNGNFIEYTDELAATEMNYGSPPYVYLSADYRNGIISDGTNVLTQHDVSGSAEDGDLMLYDAPLATTLLAFGADRLGAGFCFGLAGYGEVIWLAGTSGGGFPISSRFISLRRTGGSWEDKTGNWVAVFGSWTGLLAGHIMPDVATIAIIP